MSFFYNATLDFSIYISFFIIICYTNLIKKGYVMSEKNTLSQDEKDEILEDFKNWSGGFSPDECPVLGYDEPTHQSYIEFALDTKFADKSELVEEFFSNY